LNQDYAFVKLEDTELIQESEKHISATNENWRNRLTVVEAVCENVVTF